MAWMRYAIGAVLVLGCGTKDDGASDGSSGASADDGASDTSGSGGGDDGADGSGGAGSGVPTSSGASTTETGGDVPTGGTLTGNKECGAPGTHSTLTDDDPPRCTCDAGYDWCHPDDESDFRCCEPDIDCPDPNSHLEGNACVCDEGYDWCDPDDPNDLSCCEV